MRKIENGAVVVGVDGSTHSQAAVDWAIGYAALFDRPLLLVNATGDLGAIEAMGDPLVARHERRMSARRAIEKVATGVERLAPGLAVSTITPNGDARQVLIELSSQASIVVVGSRGHGGVGSLLLGSVSVGVATHAHCPVAVARPSVGDAGGVVVGVSADGSDRSALELASELASAESCEVAAVHAWRLDQTFLDGLTDAQRHAAVTRHRQLVDVAMTGLAEKYPQVQFHKHLVEGPPVDVLVEWSRTAETVVVGSRGRTSKVELIGSVSRAVLEHAHSTVVVVRD